MKPTVASYIQSALVELTPAGQAARERLAGTYDVYSHMNPDATHASEIPDEVVTQCAIAGTATECAAQRRALFAAGVDEITIRPYAVAGGTRADTIRTFAHEVIARL